MSVALFGAPGGATFNRLGGFAMIAAACTAALSGQAQADVTTFGDTGSTAYSYAPSAQTITLPGSTTVLTNTGTLFNNGFVEEMDNSFGTVDGFGLIATQTLYPEFANVFDEGALIGGPFGPTGFARNRVSLATFWNLSPQNKYIGFQTVEGYLGYLKVSFDNSTGALSWNGGAINTSAPSAPIYAGGNDVAPVPEPSAGLLMLLTMGVASARRMRKGNKSEALAA